MIRTLLLILLLAAPLAAQTEYHVDKQAKNQVKFISDAPVEDFEGVTDNIDGYLSHGAGGLKDDSKLYFEVDLRTLDTGIGLRNRHMREDYLHTNKYPYAKFSGRITQVEKNGGAQKVTVRGSMDIHGVKKPMQVTGTLHDDASSLRIQTEFEVKLTDHGIEVPQFMFLKIDEGMQLVLDFHLNKVKG
ncbi:MAG: YceI family protein [Bacteroidota bacterium]|nr:YceI family protein [Bacteroidota bacterium]